MPGARGIGDLLDLINAVSAGSDEMDDDQEILDLLAREIRDPELRRRIFALLRRDPATLTPQEQELVEHTVGGVLSAETERLRAETERLRGPWWWVPRFLRKPPRPPGPSSAAPSRGSPQMTTAASAEDRDDLSVRGYLRQLRWIAPGLLVAFLGMWALGMARRGVPLAVVLFFWAFVTVAAGPLIWVWGSVRSDTPGRWRALGLALLWFVGVLALFGIGYALVMAVLSGG